MRSGKTSCFNPSKTAFTSAPTNGMNPSWKALSSGPWVVVVPVNSAAARCASAALGPIALNTTQWNTQRGYSWAKRRIVPPQPISISSECAPRHKILRGNAALQDRLRERTQSHSLKRSWCRPPAFALLAFHCIDHWPLVFHTSHGATLSVHKHSNCCLSLKVSMLAQKPSYG